MTHPALHADSGLLAFGIAVVVLGVAWLWVAWEYFRLRKSDAPVRWYTHDPRSEPLPPADKTEWDLKALNHLVRRPDQSARFDELE